MSRAMRRWLRSWMRGRRCRSRGNLQGIRLGLIQAEACEPQGFNSIYLLPVVFGLSPIRFSFRRVGALAATGPATRWIAKAMPKARPKVQSNSVGFGLRAPGVGRRPSAQARRFYEPQKHGPFVLGAPPPRRCLRALRSGSLYPNKRPAIPLGIALFALSLKLAPKHCPVSASLRLRCRSAAFSRAWGNLVKTHKCILTISLLRRGARLSYRRVLPLRRAGAPTGRFTHSLYPYATRAASAQFLAPLFVRALAEILFKRKSCV